MPKKNKRLTTDEIKERNNKKARDKIKRVLEEIIVEPDDLQWHIRCEKILDEVLEDIVIRKEDLEIEEQECPECLGDGVCQDCDGSGYMYDEEDGETSEACDTCRGSGSCHNCDGTGEIS